MYVGLHASETEGEQSFLLFIKGLGVYFFIFQHFFLDESSHLHYLHCFFLFSLFFIIYFKVWFMIIIPVEQRRVSFKPLCSWCRKNSVEDFFLRFHWKKRRKERDGRRN